MRALLDVFPAPPHPDDSRTSENNRAHRRSRAYREFSEAVESREAGPGKTELVRKTIMGTEGRFSLSEVRAQLPSVSEQLIKQVLQQMKADGHLKLTGRGRGALWEKINYNEDA